MSRDYVFSKGDTLPPITGTIEDDEGAYNLSGGEVRFYMRNEETGNLKIDGEVATIVDAANGEVKYELQEGDTDTVALYEGWFVAVFSDGELTAPNAGNKDIEVTERGE